MRSGITQQPYLRKPSPLSAHWHGPTMSSDRQKRFAHSHDWRGIPSPVPGAVNGGSCHATVSTIGFPGSLKSPPRLAPRCPASPPIVRSTSLRVLLCSPKPCARLMLTNSKSRRGHCVKDSSCGDSIGWDSCQVRHAHSVVTADSPLACPSASRLVCGARSLCGDVDKVTEHTWLGRSTCSLPAGCRFGGCPCRGRHDRGIHRFRARGKRLKLRARMLHRSKRNNITSEPEFFPPAPKDAKLALPTRDGKTVVAAVCKPGKQTGQGDLL